jgi:putative transposase
MAASATSWSIRWACCSKSWRIPPMCKIGREPALVLAGRQRRFPRRFPRLRHLWADQAYTGPILDWIKEQLGWSVEVVERSPRRGVVVTADGEFQRVALPKTFEPLPRRGVVERTLAWTSRYRRMSKDYERLPATSEALIYLTGIRLLLARLTRDQK